MTTVTAGQQGAGETPDNQVIGGAVHNQPVASDGIDSFKAFEAAMAAEEMGTAKQEETPAVETPKPAAEAEAEGEAAAEAAANNEGGEEAGKETDPAAGAAAAATPPVLTKGQQKKADRVAAAARRSAEAETQAAREEAAAAKRELAELKAGKTPTAAAEPAEGEPDPEKYEYGTLDPKYHRDVRAYDREQIKKDLLADQQATAAKAKASETVQSFEKQVDSLLEEHLDYYEVVEDGLKAGKWQLPEAFNAVLMESVVGAKIAYHLAKNPAEASRIAALPEPRQLIEFGKLETTLTPAKGKTAAAQTAHIPKAGAPADVVRGNGGKFATNPATTDFAAFEKSHSHLLNQ